MRAYSGAMGSFTFTIISARFQTSSAEEMSCAPDARVVRVGEARADARARLDEHLVSGIDERLHRAAGPCRPGTRES